MDEPWEAVALLRCSDAGPDLDHRSASDGMSPAATNREKGFLLGLVEDCFTERLLPWLELVREPDRDDE